MRRARDGIAPWETPPMIQPQRKNHMDATTPTTPTAPIYDDERMHRLIKHMLWIAWPVFGYFSFHTFTNNEPLLGALTLGFACLTSIWLVFMHNFKSRRFMAWSSRLFAVTLAGLFIYYLSIGGGRALWCYAYPLIAFFLLGKREGLIMVVLFWITQSVLLLWPGGNLFADAYTSGFKFRYIMSQALVCLMTYCFESGRQRTHEMMDRHKRRLEASERQTREAIEKLKVAQSQLVQSGKLASIGELAAGVAHELNQPLMVIRGNAQLMRRQMGKPDQKATDITTFMHTIERNTKRMGYIINHLRSFSRQSPSQPEPVDINHVISNAFLLINEQLSLRNIEVVKQLQSDLPKILGEANQLEQVILNLMTNARDAFEDNGVPTHERNRRGQMITLSTRYIAERKLVEISCEDNGVGIPAKALDSIFDPFFTTKEVGKGTGLGLSISYGIIQNHNGQIEVSRTGPNGTSFRVRLPEAGPKKARPALTKDKPDAMSKGGENRLEM